MEHLLLLLLAIGMDIFLNWEIITKEKTRPNHLLNWGVRALVGIGIGYDRNWWDWLKHVLSYVPIYWFVFDYGLNWARGKKLTYLGDAWMDKIQKATIHEGPAFFFKLLLFVFCVLLIWFDYNPYNAW